MRGNFDHMFMRTVATASSQIIVDATPVYIEDLNGCQNIAALAHPSSRFVVVLRHPVRRMLSAFLMQNRYTFRERRHLTDVFAHMSFSDFVTCVRNPLVVCAFPPATVASPAGMLQILFTSLRAEIARDPDAFWSVGSPQAACLDSVDALVACLRPTGVFADLVPRAYESERAALNARAEAVFESWAAATTTDAVSKARRECDACAHDVWHTPSANETCVGCRCACRRALKAGQVEGLLYKPMLDHCFEHLDRKRFLLLDYDVTTRNITSAVTNIVRHAGLAPHDFSSVTHDDAMRRLDVMNFGLTSDTGWSHDSAPAWLDNVTIPKHVADALHNFYAADNSYLRRLTGLRLNGW